MFCMFVDHVTLKFLKAVFHNFHLVEYFDSFDKLVPQFTEKSKWEWLICKF